MTEFVEQSSENTVIDESAMTEKPKRQRRLFRSPTPKDIIFTFTLIAVVVVGGYFRFVGYNWDDFAGLHPDERFLTRNLLPLVGGTNEFTPDNTNFPDQSLLVNINNITYTSRSDIQANPNARVGALNGELSADLVTWWLSDQNRILYTDVNQMLSALETNSIDAIIIDPIAAQVALATTRQVDTFTSQVIQRIRCNSVHSDNSGVGGYFDTFCSPLNPHNANVGVYAYGTLPLFMAHFTSDFVKIQESNGVEPFDFQDGTLIWRFLSSFFDVGTIIVVFMLGMRMHNRWVGLLAAAFYAFAPLPIQKAHYGTVNSVTNFFVTVALWSAVGVQDKGRMVYHVVFGIALGAAVAGRINVLPLAGVIVLASMVYLAPVLDPRTSWMERLSLITQQMFGVVIAGIVTIITFRLANPYAFIHDGILGISINPRWLNDVTSSSFNVSGASDIPPNYQWMDRSAYLYPLKDIVLWGLGIASGILAWSGWVWSGYRLARGRILSTRNILIFTWVLVYFAYIGRIWVMTMRYYLPLYGAFAILAAWLLYHLYHYLRDRNENLSITAYFLTTFSIILAGIPTYYILSGLTITTTAIFSGMVAVVLLVFAWLPPLKSQRVLALISFSVIFSLLWGLMFTSIYRNQTTRGQASRYVWEQIPGDFAMRVEGASETTPLINIGIQNTRPESSQDPESLETSLTIYNEEAPYYSEFVAPASGTVTSVIIPHLYDLEADDGTETLSVTITSQAGDVLSIANLTSNFTRDDHFLGNSYEVEFDVPLEVDFGQRYTFRAESLDGQFAGGGSVLVTEGDWDDRLSTIKVCSLPYNLSLDDNVPPGHAGFDECNGLSSWFGLIHSYDMALSYPLDDARKRDSIISGLEVGDYISITSNRFYDTLPRNQARWPLTTAYYDMLFAGELGYDLVAMFDQSYEFGPLSVSDQHYPIYESPAWFNEFEADEAFHVYDHPTVFIFKKRADYDHDVVSYRLNEIPILQANQLVQDPETELGAKLLGVVYWSSLEADEAPTALMMPDDVTDFNQQGGTWSDRFDANSIINTNQIVGTVAWWVVMLILGFFAFPLCFVLFSHLADRGYGFTKFISLLLISYVAWLLSSFKLPMWHQSGLLIITALFLLANLWIFRRNRQEIIAYIRARWRLLLTIEALTFVLYLVMIGIRLTNPDLWHDSKGGEKPMDFAYFNAVLRTTVFPVYDPWYAGGFINYYYYGYVLTGVPVLLLKMVPSFAYNLIIPLVFALTGIGAFSLAFNIVSYLREKRENAIYDNGKPRRLGNPYVAGIVAMLLCIVVGNLDTIRVFGNGLARLGGYTQPINLETFLIEQYTNDNGVPPDPQASLEIRERANANNIFDNLTYEISHGVDLWSSMFRGANLASAGATLPIGTDRWYWGPSRVLAETPNVGGNAITEMPMFTFVYGDLHAHMINLPVLVFIFFFVFNEIVNASNRERSWFTLIMSLGIGALAVGLTRAINTWDWPTFLLFGTIGVGYAWWLQWRIINRWSLIGMLAYVGSFVALSFILVMPYTDWYAAIYNSVALWEGGKTPLWAYFDIHGLFLFLIVSLLMWETGRWLRNVKVSALRGQMRWAILLSVITVAVLLISVTMALIEYQVALIVLPLLWWIALLFFRPNQSVVMQFVLVLAGFALAITLGVEIIVIGGDIARQNTVFKFYYQAWVAFSIVGGVAFAWLFQHVDDWRMSLRWAWLTPLMVMFIIASMFPIMATRGRSFDRMAPDMPITLDGLDYMQYAQHDLMDYGDVITLNDDYQIIRWLQDNVEGTPVIMEGRSLASEYRYNGRIAINTGLPAVLGWNFHQRQQRTFDPLTRWVEQREQNIKYFYNTDDISNAARILKHYEVAYVIVSGMESVMYNPEGIAKFGQMTDLGMLETVYLRGQAQIYQVNPEAIDAYLFEQGRGE